MVLHLDGATRLRSYAQMRPRRAPAWKTKNAEAVKRRGADGEFLSATELSVYFGLPRSWLHDAKRLGMPHVAGRFQVLSAQAWLYANPNFRERGKRKDGENSMRIPVGFGADSVRNDLEAANR
jgi:hypothetical protein